jgi:hypothetical protein
MPASTSISCIATVAYLKKLDELHDERREARGRSGFGRVLSVSQSRPLALALTVGAEGASSHGRQNPYLRSSRARRPKAYDRNRIDPSNVPPSGTRSSLNVISRFRRFDRRAG